MKNETISARIARIAERHGQRLGAVNMDLEDALDEVTKTVSDDAKELLAAIGDEDLQLWRKDGDRLGSWHLYGFDNYEVNGEDSIWGSVAALCIGQSMGSIGSTDILFLDADGKLGPRGGVWVSAFDEDVAPRVVLDPELPDYTVAPIAPSLEALLRAFEAIPADARPGRSGAELREAVQKALG